MPIQITTHDKDLIILDIDGCLVNSDERLPHLLSGDREKYNELHPTDKAIPAGLFMYQMLQCWHATTPAQSRTVLFVTGRRECAREYTLAQLNKVFGSLTQVESKNLLMRPLDSNFDEHDTVLKPRLIEEAGYSLDRILLVIEDRDSTVKMWRDRGITCWQTQPGSF